jgi:hypothetical protein
LIHPKTKPESHAPAGRSRADANALTRLAGGLLAAVLLLGALASPLRAGGAARQTADGSEAAALILEVARNERAMLARRLEYTWTATVTDRELDRRGGVKKLSVSVYEVYPVRGEFARKLVSQDGVPVSRGRAEKELKKTAERLEKAAREEQKLAASKPAPPPSPAEAQNPAGLPSFGFSTGHRHGGLGGSAEISMAVWRFFHYAEFDSPRREQVRGRETIVLDFKPRADFRPADEIQKPYARLAGRLWIDAADKAVLRLEAWPTDAHPADSATPMTAEPSVVFEHERLPDGVWLERLVRIKTYGHLQPHRARLHQTGRRLQTLQRRSRRRRARLPEEEGRAAQPAAALKRARLLRVLPSSLIVWSHEYAARRDSSVECGRAHTARRRHLGQHRRRPRRAPALRRREAGTRPPP